MNSCDECEYLRRQLAQSRRSAEQRELDWRRASDISAMFGRRLRVLAGWLQRDGHLNGINITAIGPHIDARLEMEERRARPQGE